MTSLPSCRAARRCRTWTILRSPAPSPPVAPPAGRRFDPRSSCEPGAGRRFSRRCGKTRRCCSSGLTHGSKRSTRGTCLRGRGMSWNSALVDAVFDLHCLRDCCDGCRGCHCAACVAAGFVLRPGFRVVACAAAGVCIPRSVPCTGPGCGTWSPARATVSAARRSCLRWSVSHDLGCPGSAHSRICGSGTERIGFCCPYSDNRRCWAVDFCFGYVHCGGKRRGEHCGSTSNWCSAECHAASWQRRWRCEGRMENFCDCSGRTYFVYSGTL